MGQEQSQSAEGHEAARQQQIELQKVQGFQLVRLLPHSPAHQGGLLPYFDIITALDQHVLADQPEPHFKFFKAYLADHRNHQVCFTVYDIKLRSYREVFIVPTDTWGGGGLLGCSVEWARADECVQRCWHIVGILEGSPASCCPDLHEDTDYIVGMQQPDEQLIAMLKGEDDFYGRLSMWQELQRAAIERKARFPDEPIEIPHSLLLLIYNLEENCVKEVLVDMGTRPGTPLGISVATGLLHIIPTAAPGRHINNASGVDGGDVPDLANLPYMNRFYVPRDLNFQTDYENLPQPQAPQPSIAAAASTAPVAQLPQPQPPSPTASPSTRETAQQPPEPSSFPAPSAAAPSPHNPFFTGSNGGGTMHNPFAAGLQAAATDDATADSADAYFDNPHTGMHDASPAAPPSPPAPSQAPASPPAVPAPSPKQDPAPSAPATASAAPPAAEASVPNFRPPQPPSPQRPEKQPARFEFPQVPPPLDFPSFPRPQRS